MSEGPGSTTTPPTEKGAFISPVDPWPQPTPTQTPRIPDADAERIFNLLTTVERATDALETATEARKAIREHLDKSQAELNAMLVRARAGQKELFATQPANKFDEAQE